LFFIIIFIININFFIFIFTIILLILILSLKIFNIYSYNNTISSFASYSGFEIDGNKIIKYSNSGGNVVIPSVVNGVTITEIGDYAFYDLNIDSIIIPKTIISIGDYAFANNNISILNLPDSVVSIGEGAFIHNSIKEIKMSSNIDFGNACFNDNELDMDNAFFYKNNSNYEELISYGGKIKGNINIPNDNLKIIGEKAFYETYIVSISIPNSVIEIKKDAFKSNYLVELYLSNNINNIDISAFEDNSYLTDIIIDKKINTILDYPWGAIYSDLYWLKK